MLWQQARVSLNDDDSYERYIYVHIYMKNAIELTGVGLTHARPN